MPLALIDDQGHEHPIGSVLRIGSQGANHIVLADPLVSSAHATLWDQHGAIYIRDESTPGGTFVNGAKIQLTALKTGDRVQIGRSMFQVEQARPSGAVAAPARPQPKKADGWGRILAAGCLLTIGGCFALALGGFVAYKAQILTPESLMNLVGLGPGDIEVVNFRDDSIAVSILQLDVPEDSGPMGTSLDMNPYDVRRWRVRNPGRYRVDFVTADGAANLGGCTLTVRSGNYYQFVTMPETIVIRLKDKTPETGADLVVSSSTLCR